ncbi:MAG: NAD(P)/FAD-dependent oxidoreductase [Xanthomonadales bacterium]|nr:NAD(P)/FAD-dependent oxidoreductase [Xanthomonadales bacterium]
MPASSPGAERFDVVIIGAGAAGLMCAIAAGRRGRSVLVVDHANKVGKKILMSGGGRCNFTNMHCGPDNFLSANPHFCKSALSRYTPWDFIALVDRHAVPYHEKKLGQLFCDRSSKDIVGLLLAECEAVGATVRTHSPVAIDQFGPPHRLTGPNGVIGCESLVIATGGYSIPRMGATGFGFDLARELGLAIQPTRAALVPFVFEGRKLEQIRDLAGVSVDSYSEAGGTGFRENILFTHQGLSGPAMLQASSYWHPGEPVSIDLLPDIDLIGRLRDLRSSRPRLTLKKALAEILPRRVAERWCELWLVDKPMAEVSDAEVEAARQQLKPWRVWPAGTEGYRTAEVTIGGVDTGALSSKTMECRDHPGLFFIGEVVDVTGHLGGHNFQWAWASGHAAGEVV